MWFYSYIKVVLFYYIGFWGLPVAFSINSILTTIVLFALYNKQIYKYKIIVLFQYLLKLLLISAIAVIIPKYIGIVISDFWAIRLVINSVLFIIIFFTLTIRYEKDISSLFYNRIKQKLLKVS